MTHQDNNMLIGLVFITGGVLLLLYTLGIIQTGINIIFMLISVLAIIYGLLLSGLYARAQKLIRKKH